YDFGGKVRLVATGNITGLESLYGHEQEHELRFAAIQPAAGVEDFLPNHVKFGFIGLRPDPAQFQDGLQRLTIMLGSGIAQDGETHPRLTRRFLDLAAGRQEAMKRKIDDLPGLQRCGHLGRWQKYPHRLGVRLRVLKPGAHSSCRWSG